MALEASESWRKIPYNVGHKFQAAKDERLFIPSGTRLQVGGAVLGQKMREYRLKVKMIGFLDSPSIGA